MDAVARKVIEASRSLAVDEVGLLWNLKDDLERMENKVSSLRLKLADAEARASDDAIRSWMERLKDVLLDADDLLDDVSTEALRMKVMTGNRMEKEVKRFFSESNPLTYGLKIGHQLKGIRKRLDDIFNDKVQMDSIPTHSTPLKTPVVDGEIRQTHSFVSKDEVIGREKEKELILSYANVTDGVSIVPIVGVGGLGKTALAKIVYNDEFVQKCFDPKMWVCVSEEFSLRQIAEKMLERKTNSEMDQVQRDLRKKIEGKKFFLVLDDVWNQVPELWCELKKLLMVGAKGSTIIVTTRFERVAKIVTTREGEADSMHPHEPLSLKNLDEEKSRQLFCRVALEGGNKLNDLQLVKGIVKKCAGMPLAIRSLGNLLRHKSLDDWVHFRDTELSKISNEKENIFPILKLSYDYLGSDEKNCFAYCSLFPKDFEIEREKLIQLWIAQGFINSSSNQTRCPEDVGGEYFMNLLSGSFFQDVGTDQFGDIRTCKMHDLMHELAVLVAKNECAVIKKGREYTGLRLRHLSFDFESELSSQELLPNSLQPNKLRTFLLPFGGKCESDDEGIFPWAVSWCSQLRDKSVLSSLTSSQKFLRVLDVSHVDGLTTIPKGIGRLKHLRYLDLSSNGEIKKLPQSITELHSLQTLKLNDCYNLKELPMDINKLVCLRHLELDNCNELRSMPQGLGQLTCLQTLTRFILDHQRSGSARISGLNGLSNIRGKLRIEGLQHLQGNTAEVESAKVFLERQCFQELQLVWGVDIEHNTAFESEEVMILQGEQLQPRDTLKILLIWGCYGKSLPYYIANLLLLHLSSLQEIQIESCNGLTSLPDCIENLSSLQDIQIRSCNGLTSLPDFIGNLSSLQDIRIESCDGLTSLPDSIGNLSSLQEIRIGFCNGLTSLPDSIGNLSSLQDIRIWFCDGLTSLPDSIGNLLSLQGIRIEFCHGLTSLPHFIGNLSSLQKIRIWCCHGLTSLPDSIGNLSSLQEIRIGSCNGLTSLPDSIGNLSSLQDIRIGSCDGLTSLPNSIGNLSSLQDIRIWSSDGLTSLPDSMGNLSSLQNIRIGSCNGLTSLPDSIGNLSSLQHIQIEACDNLTSLLGSIKNLPQLERL